MEERRNEAACGDMLAAQLRNKGGERRHAERKSWRRGWDLNPRVEVLQTSPLNHLGTAPSDFQYIENRQSLPRGAGLAHPRSVFGVGTTASRMKRADSSGGVGQ